MTIDKLYTALKATIIKNNCDIFNSNDQGLENENFDKLDEANFRTHYILKFEKNDPFMFFMYRTIRPIVLMVIVDEDIEKNTNNIIDKQICIVVLSQWQEDESVENLKRHHYFINDAEDFDIVKIENFFNELLNELPYNNLSLVWDDFVEFYNVVNDKIKE